MKKLSIFVDESGDFGDYDKKSNFYIVTFVFHEQSNNLGEQLFRLKRELQHTTYINNAIHVGPLIRKENEYYYLNCKERRTILNKLYFFTIKCPILFKIFVLNKEKYKNTNKLENEICRVFNSFFLNNKKYFNRFDSIILYYDNGQHELTKILKKELGEHFQNYEIKKVLPIDYVLFQVADMLCTLFLINEKIKYKNLSKSELYMFYSKKRFIKDYIKRIKTKSFN